MLTGTLDSAKAGSKDSKHLSLCDLFDIVTDFNISLGFSSTHSPSSDRGGEKAKGCGRYQSNAVLQSLLMNLYRLILTVIEIKR